jgi:hypothetical protein
MSAANQALIDGKILAANQISRDLGFDDRSNTQWNFSIAEALVAGARKCRMNRASSHRSCRTNDRPIRCISRQISRSERIANT